MSFPLVLTTVLTLLWHKQLFLRVLKRSVNISQGGEIYFSGGKYDNIDRSYLSPNLLYEERL